LYAGHYSYNTSIERIFRRICGWIPGSAGVSPALIQEEMMLVEEKIAA
jgi:hypothetical protein